MSWDIPAVSLPELLVAAWGTLQMAALAFALAGAMYLVMAWPMMHGVRRLERRFARGRLTGSKP